MDLSLANKTAVITGGASGIGKETARYFIREGARVLLADRDEERLDEAAQELAALGGDCAVFSLDVRDYGACQAMTAFARERWGAIDVLVASAGVVRNEFFLDSNPADWEGLIDINVRGVLNTVHAVAPAMVEQASGSIVLLSSEAAKTGEKRIAVYGATKGAVASFAKAFALEMGRHNVRVNAVCPAVTLTPMTLGAYADPAGAAASERYQAAAKLYPLGRLGEAADIAALIAFLASAQASWITGQAISVNGGFGRS